MVRRLVVFANLRGQAGKRTFRGEIGSCVISPWKECVVMKVRTGFTLIELLVVIAIIAVLAAILFPVFAEARASARNTQDMSNVRQIGVACVLYLHDYDERYVPIGAWNDPSITPHTNPDRPGPGLEWQGWGLRLLPYAKSRQIF